MDFDGQLTFEDSPLSSRFNEGLSYIQKGNFQQTLEVMEEIFKKNPDFTGVIETIKTIKFWQNRWNKFHQFPQGMERSNYLFTEWNNYLKFTSQTNITYEKVIIYIKNFIFKNIITNLIIAYQQSDIPNVDILLQIGEILASIEEYQKAIESLEYARMFKKKDSFLLSLLADSYYKIGQTDKAKMMFREAFFNDPQKIDLSKIKTDLIHKITGHMNKEANFSSHLLLEWFPVYGVLLNVFNIKREINGDELAKLNQDTQELENKYFSQKAYDNFIEPRLINHYFWLIDFYTLQNKNKDYVKIYFNKLKDINKEIYKKYLDLIETNHAKGKLL